MTPHARVGILGGGQLAQMLADAGNRIGIASTAYDPTPDACAQTACPVMHQPFDDVDALTAFAKSVDVVTCEFENVPMIALETCAKVCPVRPGPHSFYVARNRIREKHALRDAGWATADFVEIRTDDDLTLAAETLGFPCIIKSAEGGYDGYGQQRVHSLDKLRQAWIQMNVSQAIVEKLVEFSRELSIIGCRAPDGTHITWPIVHNHHDDGILLWTIAPAQNVSEALETDAAQRLVALMEQLDHIGVLTLEMFDTPDGLVVNEIAPRVHNSGHWSIEGTSASQFENHMRAMVGRHLVIPELAHTSVMVNLLGSIPDLASLRAVSDTHIHEYGKAPRGRRKIGHVTSLCHSSSDVASRRDKLLSVIRPDLVAVQ
ncbi:MAG: 5-(carboxyamino)imidazole ribonucleotide synthase [Phycisphaeraceae bacterium]|nr:5-(carboxyamino)imidazole ribonucleotide synthase [Phycisphaerales bacterium]MCB9861358.1 5-(carboxyamino)imidazole ribonucleotide synthase [Phycisphaeraceae bacterium]